MSLKWLHQNLLKAKVFNEFELKKFDFKDELVSQQLRNSIFSVDSQEFPLDYLTKDSVEIANDIFLEKFETPENSSEEEDEEEIFEVARSCPNDCEHENCPFLPRLYSSSEVFFTMESRFSENLSSVSLVRQVSSLSMMEMTYDGREKNEILSISRIVPLRNNSAIVHWNVKSFLGIRGYKVIVDGVLASRVNSAERTSAFISPVNMSIPHHFTVTVVPDIYGVFSSNYLRKLSTMEPAGSFYSPN